MIYRPTPVNVLLVIAFTMTSGCGSNDPYAIVPVSGVLTYQGEPVSGIQMQFVPQEGRASIAYTDSEGRFKPFYRPKQYGVQKGRVMVVLQRGESGGIIGAERGNKKINKLVKLFGAGGDPVEVTIDKATDDLNIDLVDPPRK